MSDPKQAKCLTDPTWRFYRDTDLKRTFARIRRQMKEQQRPADTHVVPMKKRGVA